MAKSTDSVSNLAPFLTKCYDMVDDQSTDNIISWSESCDSFVIWDMTAFSRDLLPKYFKHKNFSSFMRQLNIYGFRKADTDRWEFANEGFIKDQKHLLKTIQRRKHPQSSAQKNPKQEEHMVGEAPDELDYERLQNEVEILNFDKSSLMQELVKLKERHESSQSKLSLLQERLQGMENNQQQLLSFLVMVMQNPGLLVQLLQPKESSWRMSESAKITPVLPDNALVRYRPISEASAPTPHSDQTVKHDISFDKVKDFFMNFDFSSSPLDESYLMSENCGSIRLPELDLTKLEQFLLSSPTRDDSQRDSDGDIDGDDPIVSELEMEMRHLSSCFDNPSSLELLTERVECSSPGTKAL